MLNISDPLIDHNKVIEKKADILYLQAPVSNGTILLIALLYYFFLKGYSDSLSHIIWPAIISLLAGCRLFLWHLRHKSPDTQTPAHWMIHYTILTALLGCVWGSVFFLPYSSHDEILYIALLLIFIGVTTSAVTVLSVLLTAFFSYTLPILFSFTLAMYTLDKFDYLFFTLAATIYYLMLSLFSLNSNKQIISSICLELHNQTLIKQLQTEVEQRESLVQARTEQLIESNQSLADSEQRIQNVITGADLGYWDWNYQTGHQEVNNRWLEILGLTRFDINNNVSDWSTRVHPDDKERMVATVEDAIKNKKPYVSDFRMKHKDGHWVWIQGSGSLVEFDTITHEPLRICGTHQDISYRKEMEQELEYKAKHDYLTGLYNRIELEKHFQDELLRAIRYQHDISIFMIDIDHFKQINDSYGHQAGDQILKQFALFLQNTVRTSDYVARYGGEEFVVILPETSLVDAKELAERLRAKTAELSMQLNDFPYKITISLGLASYPEHAVSYDALLELADSAMYQAKQSGRNCIRTPTV